jgi:SAM-dependent methyltransferase
LNVLMKLTRGDSTRRTRFHSGRGTVMPLRAWFAVPLALWHRFRSRDDGPWLVPSATDELARLVTSASHILELGAGHSTPWFAARAASVRSFEHDGDWGDRVEGELRVQQLRNAQVEVIEPSEFIDAIARLPDDSVDVVLVDCAPVADRVACAAIAARKVRPGGYLVFDDSDRREYHQVDDVLDDWSVKRFCGLKPVPLVATETSIYRRPDVSNDVFRTRG